MTITITAPGEYITDSASVPTVGRKYSLDDAECGTNAQNKLFHAILDIYYKSGAWSYQGSGYKQGATYDEFRNMIKRKLGAGFEAYVWVDPDESPPFIHDAKTRGEIPKRIPVSLIRGRLKSWSLYTKTERRKTIDLLFSEMDQVGVRSTKLDEIRDGLEAAFNASH
jgi:hypothetical protein